MSDTPIADALEENRVALQQQRTPAYGDALRKLREVERENAMLKKLGGTLAHYVKAARKGDSPLVHDWIVEAIDDALAAWEALKK